MHQLGMLNTTVQSVLEYKVGKYVFGRQNTPSTHIVLKSKHIVLKSKHRKSNTQKWLPFHAIKLRLDVFYVSTLQTVPMLMQSVHNLPGTSMLFGWRIHPTFDSSVQSVPLHCITSVQNRLMIIVQVISNFKKICVSHWCGCAYDPSLEFAVRLMIEWTE